VTEWLEENDFYGFVSGMKFIKEFGGYLKNVYGKMVKVCG
jgi:hypothetical protein